MTEVVIFGIFGVIYTLLGLAWLVKQEATNNFLLGVFARLVTLTISVVIGLAVGVFLIGFAHVSSWSIVLNIIGWIAVAKSVLIILRPFWMQSMMQALFLRRKLCYIWAILALVFGWFMLYIAFFAL